MFPKQLWKRRKDYSSQAEELTAAEHEQSPSHTTVPAQDSASRATEVTEKPKHTGGMARDCEDPLFARLQGGTQLGDSKGSPNGQSPPRLTRLRLQPSPSGASIENKGHSTEGSFSSLPDAYCPQQCSSTSTGSVSSYYTASSSLPHDLSPISSAETHLFSSMKDELLKSVREIVEKMTQLEGKVDKLEHKFDARMQEVEQQIQLVQREMQNVEAAETAVDEEKGGAALPRLPPLREEDNTDEEGDTLDCSPRISRGSSPGRWRLYTDTIAAKMARHKVAMKRKEFANKKSLSVQDSRFLQKTCNQKVIMWLTQRVTNWKFIARWLGLPENEIMRIESDHKQDREQCYQMFLRWKAVDPGNYTYPVLGDVLRKESQELYNEYVKEIHRVESSIDLPVKK